MILTVNELNENFQNAENNLFDINNRIDYDRNNFDDFPNEAGVYALYFNDELIYIGETADLKKRMKDLKNTYNHTFRRKIGFHLFSDAQIIIRKFSETIEIRLNLIFQNCFSVSFIQVNFGRSEIENYLIQNNQNLLNSITRRGN